MQYTKNYQNQSVLIETSKVGDFYWDTVYIYERALVS